MIYARYFKVSLLFTQEELEREVMRVISWYKGYHKGFVFKFLSVEKGLEMDDFVQMLETVVIKFSQFKAPRIVKNIYATTCHRRRRGLTII